MMRTMVEALQPEREQYLAGVTAALICYSSLAATQADNLRKLPAPTGCKTIIAFTIWKILFLSSSRTVKQLQCIRGW